MNGNLFKKVVGAILYNKKVSDKLNDETYLKLRFYFKFSYKLNLRNPKTYNEKIQWLKLNDRKPIYTNMVDKYESKKIISDKIGDKYLIPTYGVYDDFDSIDFACLPKQFVIKCTHDSGSIIICKDKDNFDVTAAKAKIEKFLNTNYYSYGREWPYKNVKPRILVEKYMEDSKHTSLPVYKVFNFNNGPQLIQAIQDDKSERETIDYFDTDWNLLDLKQNFPNSKTKLDRPKCLEQMLEISKTLSKGIPFIRTDFYVINGELYFSEFTFYSDGGYEKFYPNEYDLILGNRIDLNL